MSDPAVIAYHRFRCASAAAEASSRGAERAPVLEQAAHASRQAVIKAPATTAAGIRAKMTLFRDRGIRQPDVDLARAIMRDLERIKP